MKKEITLIALSAILSFNTFAQDYQKSIGARLGVNSGITYKQFISPHNAVEIMGTALFSSGGKTLIYSDNSGYALYSTENSNSYYFGLSGEYLWSWNVAQGMSWFVGPGFSVGMWTGAYSGFNVAVNGMVGVEYKLAPVPLALSVDLHPHFYLLNSVGISPLVGALSIRYVFGQ
jgi:hypothetical protein